MNKYGLTMNKSIFIHYHLPRLINVVEIVVHC